MTTAFQEMLSQDIKDIFLNPEEFGETHLVDGKEMVVILDDNELVERNDKVKIMAEGLHERRLLLYVSAEDFGPEPLISRQMELDGEYFTVSDVSSEGGMYGISLEANRS